eukprot:c25267_g1_i2 orf=566-3574(+)
MEHVHCLLVPGAGIVRHEDGFRMHQTWSLGMLCKAKAGSWTTRPQVSPSLSLPNNRICHNMRTQRPSCTHARVNDTAEFDTLAEQQAVDTNSPSTVFDSKSTPSGLAETRGQGSSNPENEKGSALKGIFPGGLRRAEVRLPGLVMTIRVSDVLGPEAKEFLDKMDSAIAGGFTMVVLESGGGTGGDEASSGARLYEAARLLKASLRGRAELLIADRVDIAAAAGASGVLLSDEGLPAVVARSMMQNVSPDTPVLPLVARSVSSAESALLATASEGADLLILQGLGEVDTKIVIDNVREKVSIPIFSQDSRGLLKGEGEAFPSLSAGANGLIYDSIDLKSVSTEDVGGLVSSLVAAMITILQDKSAKGPRSSSPADVQDQSSTPTATNYATSKSLWSLDLEFRAILEEERSLLSSLIKLLKEASPEMGEVSLLIDAVAQLDEPFLLMVVGEFNSGKSSVINALLGKRYLPEGVLPTTNEIALLKYAGDGMNGKERSERHPDGHFLYYLPAELLKEINLVDTPGTNVILKRQQRLTEEFVPRADLVLFVLSADRPFTESEMTFLQYIMQWDKRVIFLLNKSDIFSDKKELEEVVKYVKDNAQKLLSVEQATIYAVSARKAFQAKREVGVDNGSLDVEELLQNNSWNLSGFKDLEKFIADFLGGSTDAGAERRRLKLATPLGIALTLLEACNMQLSVEANTADADLEWLNGLSMQLESHQKDLENSVTLQRQGLSDLIDGAKGRAQKFVDSVLRLSNIDAVASYLLGGDRRGTLPVAGGFDAQVMGSVQKDLQRLLQEHRNGLKENRAQQVTKYRELVTRKWPSIMVSKNGLTNDYRFASTESGSKETNSIVVLDGFDTQAAKVVLEQELRDVVFTTFGGLGAAGVSASVLTSILPNTLEDLLALALCSAGGLVGVWNLPKRREEVKGKVLQVAESFANQLEAAMVAEMKETMDELREDIGELLQPYLEAAQAEVKRVRNLQEGVSQANIQIQSLRRRVQNLGTS